MVVVMESLATLTLCVFIALSFCGGNYVKLVSLGTYKNGSYFSVFEMKIQFLKRILQVTIYFITQKKLN